MKFVRVLGLVLAALLGVGSVSALGASPGFAQSSSQRTVQSPTPSLDAPLIPPGVFPESDGDLSNGENLDITLLPDLSWSNSIMIWGVSGGAESREQFGNQVGGALGLVASRDFTVNVDNYGDYSADGWSFEGGLGTGFDKGLEDGNTSLDPNVGTFDVELSLSKMFGNVENGDRRIEIDTAALARVARIHGYTAASFGYCPIFDTVSYDGSTVEPQVKDDRCAKWTLDVNRTATPMKISITESGSPDGMRNLFAVTAGIAAAIFVLGALVLLIVRTTGSLKTVGRASLAWIISFALLGSMVWMLGAGIVLISDIGSKIALTSDRTGLSLLTASLVPTVLPGVAVALLGLILAFGRRPVQQSGDKTPGAGLLAPRTDVASHPRQDASVFAAAPSAQQSQTQQDPTQRFRSDGQTPTPKDPTPNDSTPGDLTGDWRPPQ